MHGRTRGRRERAPGPGSASFAGTPRGLSLPVPPRSRLHANGTSAVWEVLARRRDGTASVLQHAALTPLTPGCGETSCAVSLAPRLHPACARVPERVQIATADLHGPPSRPARRGASCRGSVWIMEGGCLNGGCFKKGGQAFRCVTRHFVRCGPARTPCDAGGAAATTATPMGVVGPRCFSAHFAAPRSPSQVLLLIIIDPSRAPRPSPDLPRMLHSRCSTSLPTSSIFSRTAPGHPPPATPTPPISRNGLSSALSPSARGALPARPHVQLCTARPDPCPSTRQTTSLAPAGSAWSSAASAACSSSS